ncbi:MAG: PHP domain-containing protein [Spirochaetaceae bacterium]
MATYRADCHLHSCLSPCGDLESSPTAIVDRATSLGLDLIALTDHNSALNCPTFEQAASRAGIAALSGIEATTSEEVHVLCLFEKAEQALELGRRIYEALPEVPLRPERYGDQVYVDLDEMILGTVDTHLIYGCSYSMDELRALVGELGGLFVPAHIDRAVNSVYSQLGFLPEGPYDAVEVTRRPCPLDTHGHTRISNSDAHFLDDIGARSFSFEAQQADFHGLKEALARGATSLGL